MITVYKFTYTTERLSAVNDEIWIEFNTSDEFG